MISKILLNEVNAHLQSIQERISGFYWLYYWIFIYIKMNVIYIFFSYTVGAIIVNLFITSLLIFIIIDFVLFLILYSFCIYLYILTYLLILKVLFLSCNTKNCSIYFYWKNLFFSLTFYLLYKKTRKEPLNKFLLLW